MFFLFALVTPSFLLSPHQEKMYCFVHSNAPEWWQSGSKLTKEPFDNVQSCWLDLLAVVCPIFARVHYIIVWVLDNSGKPTPQF